MLSQFSRTQLLLGVPTMEKLKASRVAISGLGGMGGYVAEALIRSGVGALDLTDDDKVCLTSLNRQILALRLTVGRYKVEVVTARVAETNSDCRVTVHRMFYLSKIVDHFDFRDYDYMADAVSHTHPRAHET